MKFTTLRILLWDDDDCNSEDVKMWSFWKTCMPAGEGSKSTIYGSLLAWLRWTSSYDRCVQQPLLLIFRYNVPVMF